VSGGGQTPAYGSSNYGRPAPSATQPTSYPGQGSAVGQPFYGFGGNFGGPGAPNPDALRLAQSLNPADNNQLIGLLGEQGAHQYANMYGPMGTMSNGNAIMDQWRGQNGNTQGISDLTPAMLQQYQQNGVIANGQWAKKMDNNGQWVPV